MRKFVLSMVVAMFAMTAVVKADSIYVMAGSPTVTGSGPYTWSYDMELSAGSTIQSGDYFIILDFVGFTGTWTAPAGWTLTTPLVSSPIFGTSTSASGTDSPSIINLKWTYSGANIVGAAAPFGTFTADSIYKYKTLGIVLAQDHSTAFPSIAVVNSGATVVPAVPLPAAAWAGLGLLGLVGAIRMRKA